MGSLPWVELEGVHLAVRVVGEGRVRRSTGGGAEGHPTDLSPPAASSDPNLRGSALNSDHCSVSALNSDRCSLPAPNSDLK